MAGYFVIAGRKVATHHIVLGTLAAYAVGIKMALPSTDKTKQPPINAATPAEGEFVQQFLKAFEDEEKKTKAAH